MVHFIYCLLIQFDDFLVIISLLIDLHLHVYSINFIHYFIIILYNLSFQLIEVYFDCPI